MFDLGLALFLALIAAGIGKRFLGSLGELPDHPLDALALATPLGLGFLGLATLALGEAGRLNLTGLSVMLAVATEIGVLGGLRLVRGAARGLPRSAGGEPWCRADWLLLGLLGLAIAATGLAALAPVTDGDALCYHLQVPKFFLIQQSVGFDPDLHETVYPLLTELLYAIALEFRGPVACRCIQWVLGLILAACVAALARPSLGRRAWWAAVPALLVPAISNGMSAPLSDVSLASFGAAAILAGMRHLERSSRASAVVAGISCGLALGVKYPALVLVGLLTVAFVGSCFRRTSAREPSGIRSPLALTAGFLTMALLVGGPWYLRAYVHTGNPVYPFFKTFFGGAGLDEVLADVKRPLSVGPWNLLVALVPLTLEPHRFDSFAHQFGPAFLLFLPALLLERAPRRVLALAGLGYAFLVLCLTQRQSMRFLLVALGPMSVGLAYLASRWQGRRTVPARLLLSLLLAVLAMEAGVAVTRGARAAGVLLGRETADQFLARCEPTYQVGRWIAGNLAPSARLIGQDHRGFYIPRGYTMELAHRRRTGLGTQGESCWQIVEKLKSEGFTHLMLCPPLEASAIEFDPTLGRLLRPWLRHRAPLYSRELADPDGILRRYSIYDLADESALTPAASARSAEESRR
jgi:hypothetical protein